MLPKTVLLNTFIRLLLVVLTSALIGCSPTPTVDDDISSALAQSSTPQPEPDVTATDLTAVAQVTISGVPTNADDPTVTATASPTITVTPTATATPSPTVTATPYPTNFSAFCEKRELESVDDHATGISGFLAYVVLEDAAWQAEGAQTGLVGGNPLQPRPFPPDSDIQVIGFSPSGNWFAYNKKDSNQPAGIEPYVYLISVEGEALKTPMQPETTEGRPYLGITWISDELLMIQYIRVPTSGLGSGTYLVDSYAIFNAFTGEERNDLLDDLPDWDEWRTPYFSPDMTRVVYFTESHSQVGLSIALWDIEEQVILWTKPFRSITGVEEKTIGFGGFSQAAFWSPDSQAFVFTTGGQAADHGHPYASYLIDRNGLEERLLLSSSDFAGVMALGGIWSPDSRFIYSSYRDILIYDLATDEIIALCTDYSSYRVAWSPDGQYLAYVEEVSGENHLLLFNVRTGEVTSLGKIRDISSLQWLENEAWLDAP